MISSWQSPEIAWDSAGLGVHFIEKYKLNPAKVMMVGDMTSDKTFATHCGFQYVDAEDFFA